MLGRNRAGLHRDPVNQATDARLRAERLTSRARRMVLEKWRSWNNCGGDLESRFSRDFLPSVLTVHGRPRASSSRCAITSTTAAGRAGRLGPAAVVTVPTAVMV